MKINEYGNELQYHFDGMILDYDDPGNIAYGVVAKAAGISDFVSHAGAGAVNFKNAIENAIGSKNFDKKISKAIKIGDIDMINNDDFDKALIRELSYWQTLGDDPRDSKMIELGFSYYYKV